MGRGERKSGEMTGNNSHRALDNSHCCFLSYYISEYLLIFLYSMLHSRLG